MSKSDTERDLVKSFVSRIQHLDEEAKNLNDDRRGVYKEAKDKQLNTKALKRLIANLRKDDAEVAEETEVFERYRSFINGTSYATRGRVDHLQPKEPASGRPLIRNDEGDPESDPGLHAGSSIPDPDLDIRNQPFRRGAVRPAHE